MIIQFLTRVRRDRRGISAIVFGVAGITISMLLGIAIDLSSYMYLRSQFNLAADAGVLTAVTTATTQLASGQHSYLTLGHQAGLARFNAQAGDIIANTASISNGSSASGTVPMPSVALSMTGSGTAITGVLNWSTTYTPFFATLFGVSSWPLSGIASSSESVRAPYLNVYIVMDDSPSMLIGATDDDIAAMQEITPCAATNAWYWNNEAYVQQAPGSGIAYWNYQCSGQEGAYDGGLSCPFPATRRYTFTTFTPSKSNSSPTSGDTQNCKGWLSMSNGRYPLVGVPCAFACHYDATTTAGAGRDFYALARGTIGTAAPITLRMDVVKGAVKSLIAGMQAASAQDHINTAIFTLDATITKIYPASGDAGDNWAAAAAAVGSPPTVAFGPDSGVQPILTNDSEFWTDYKSSLATLASELTAAGSGTQPSDPEKALILITDGVSDFGVRGIQSLGPIDPAYCEPFKAMGYTVFVLYTKYYPLMVDTYLKSMKNFVEGTGSGTLSYNLQKCATSPSDYYAATDATDMWNALQGFLKIAMGKSAHLTK